MNITKLFLDTADRLPDKKAIVEKNGEITFGELKQEVLQTAAYFRKKGIEKGDRVMVFIPMSIELYKVVLSLFYIGATAVFLDEWVNKKRLEICCQLANCKGFIGTGKAQFLRVISKEVRKVPIFLKTKKRANQEISMADVEEYHTALITFTTGSTGTPKAANRTHVFLKHQFDSLIDEIQPKVEEVDMPVLPIVLFLNLGVGCTSVIADFKSSKPDKIKPDKIYNQILDNQVSRIIASPFFIKKLSEFAISKDLKITEIKKVFTGGAPVFPQEAELYTSAFPKAEVKIVYGSTEAEPISSILADDLIQKSAELSKGLPVGNTYDKIQVKIIRISDDDISVSTKVEFDEWILPDGEIGEIVVSGRHVLKAYSEMKMLFEGIKLKLMEIFGTVPETVVFC